MAELAESRYGVQLAKIHQREQLAESRSAQRAEKRRKCLSWPTVSWPKIVRFWCLAECRRKCESWPTAHLAENVLLGESWPRRFSSYPDCGCGTDFSLAPQSVRFFPGDCPILKTCKTKFVKFDAINLIMMFYIVFWLKAGSGI